MAGNEKGNIRIALLQMTSGIDPVANAATLANAAQSAADQGAAILFAPEMSGLIDRDRRRAAPRIVPEAQSPFIAAAATAARTHRLWIHMGSCPVLADDGPTDRWRNRSILFDDVGRVRARYDKIHLFDVDLPTGESWRESNAYAPGEAVVAAQTPFARIGMTICYDLRFAGLFDRLGAAGCHLIAVPSAFTVPTGAAHWHLLLRARAVEQGAYIVAAAQGGRHEDGRETFGHSLVVDPWGEIIHDSQGEAGLSIVEIDLSRVDEVRRRLPVISHRRELPPVTVTE